MQHIVEELVQLSSEDYNRENYNRQSRGAVIFQNVYYRIEATKYRQGDPRNLLEGAAYQVPLRHASGEVLTEYSNVVFSSASTNWHNPVVKEHHHRSRELADFMFSNTPSR